MKADTPAADRRQQRMDAIQDICTKWQGRFAPSYDHVASLLNEREVRTAHGHEWTGILVYAELKRWKVRLEELCEAPPAGRVASITKKAGDKQEGILKVKRAIKRYLMDWDNRDRLPRYTEIALHLNCEFIQVSDDDEPWDADTVEHFMDVQSLDRQDFVPISGFKMGRVTSV